MERIVTEPDGSGPIWISYRESDKNILERIGFGVTPLDALDDLMSIERNMRRKTDG